MLGGMGGWERSRWEIRISPGPAGDCLGHLSSPPPRPLQIAFPQPGPPAWGLLITRLPHCAHPGVGPGPPTHAEALSPTCWQARR